jgi:hypothetical protein
MRILSAFKSWFAPPARNDFYGLAERSRRVPPAELAFAEAALANGGPLAERFATQLRMADGVYRLRSADGTYELRVTTTENLLVRGVPLAGWRSEVISAHGLPHDRALELWLDVSIAGIVGIQGRALDGEPWPEDWSIDPSDLEAVRSRAPWMVLPTPAELREQRMRAVDVIETWLGEPGILRGKRGVVAVKPPAAEAMIAAFEDAQGIELHQAYRELLLVANGFEIGNLVVLGTADAYRLDIRGADRLVIAPPTEDGALVLAPSGEVRFVDFGDDTSEGRIRAPDLRAWVRRRVGVARST